MKTKKQWKPKLNDELIEKVCHCVDKGCSIEDVCCTLSIDKQSYQDWMHRGELYSRGKYYEFRRRVGRSLAVYEMKLVHRITNAGKRGSWRADAWFLERRFPERWGKERRYRPKSGKLKNRYEEQTTTLHNGIVYVSKD